MNFLEKIIAALDGKMPTPQAYGWFHLMFLGIMVAFTVGMALLFKNKSKRAIKIVVLVYALVCLVFELYKQLLYSFNATTGVWRYQWYAFPFQLCSTPMFVALLAVLLKEGKVQDSLYCYLATYGMMAGLMVMIMPGDVFTSSTGINIQTMVHHGGQVFIGAFLLATKKVKLSYTTPLKAIPVFLSLVGIALALNLTVVHFVSGQTFNMFFISPHFPSTLPVLADIYVDSSYPVFLFLYVFALTAGAFVITLFIMLISRIIPKQRLKSKRRNLNV